MAADDPDAELDLLDIVDLEGPSAGAAAELDLTEDILASEFTRRHGAELRYVHEWNRWLRWDGTRWRFDRVLAIYDLARDVCREATATEKPHVRARFANAKTVAAVTRLAMADPIHARTGDVWDRDAWMLNTPGGTVDLRSGKLRPHDGADGLTKSTIVTPGGQCPTWEAGLRRWAAGDQDLIAFLQRLVGYFLTGLTTEHVFAFLYGTGANGKGSFLNTLTTILGEYATVASVDTFTATTGERHPADLAMLRGARLVTAQETTEGRRWDETRIKALTGGDPITARFMRADFFTFTPQLKLVIAGNHKPGLRAVDEAMRRRLLLVPFTATIPAPERDKALGEKLRAEGPGILAWAIRGCLAWQSEGLRPPASVLAATEDYFETQDAIGRWLEECCVTGPNVTATKADLFASWKAWAERGGEFVLPQRRLLERLGERLDLDETRLGKRCDRAFIGIGLRVES